MRRAPSKVSPLELEEVIDIGPKDRAVFCGRTKSGKTTLAKKILPHFPFVVAIDPKGTFDLPGGRLTHTPADFKRQKVEPYQPQIYRPNVDYIDDVDAYDEVFRHIYFRQNTTVYIDEVYGVCSGPRVPKYYLACITRGAELHIRVISSTQRPANIPQVILSESDHFVMFELQKADDRKRMSESIGDIATEPLTIPHSFYYYLNGGGPTRRYILDLEDTQ